MSAGTRRPELTELCRLMISSLNDICVRNRDAPTARTPFHSVQVPPMSLHDYAKRIFKYSQCSEECFPVTLVLITRYLLRQPDNIKLTFYNSHRLFITALMISAKLRDDSYYSNAYYSSIGGVSPLEMNALELQFLKDVEWDLFVDADEFYDTIQACEEQTHLERFDHLLRTFKNKREEAKKQEEERQQQQQKNAEEQRAAALQEKQQSVSQPLKARDEVEGLSSSESRPSAPGNLSGNSSAQDVTMFVAPTPQGMPLMRKGSSKDSFQPIAVESGTTTPSRGATPTTRTPTKVHFDPSVKHETGGKKSRRRGRNQ